MADDPRHPHLSSGYTTTDADTTDGPVAPQGEKPDDDKPKRKPAAKKSE